MGKFLRISLLTMLLITVLISGTALAGVKVSEGKPANVSAQILGAARNVILSGNASATNAINIPAIAYELGQSLVTGNILNFEFDSGVMFLPSTTYRVCAFNSANYPNASNSVQVGDAATTSSGAQSLNIQVSVPTNAANSTGNVVYITDYTQCNHANSVNATVRISANTGVGLKKVSIKQMSAGTTLVGPESANAVNIVNEIIPTLITTASTVTIDYQGTGVDGKKFTNNSTVGGTSNALFINRTGTFANNQTSGTANVNDMSLTPIVTMYFKDSQEWQGINKIFVVGGGSTSASCTSSSSASTVAAAITPPTSGTATINASNAFSAAASGNYIAACFEVSGNTVLQTRTIKAAYKIDFGSGGIGIDNSNNFENIQIWDVNAYQGLIPWLVKSDSLRTYCLLNNNSSLTANVFLNTYSAEQGGAISSLNLGTVAGGKSQLYIFGESVVADSSTYNLTNLQASERYSAIITATVGADQVTITCNQDNIGFGRRIVPVLTVQTTGPKWKQ